MRPAHWTTAATSAPGPTTTWTAAWAGSMRRVRCFRPCAPATRVCRPACPFHWASIPTHPPTARRTATTRRSSSHSRPMPTRRRARHAHAVRQRADTAGGLAGRRHLGRAGRERLGGHGLPLYARHHLHRHLQPDLYQPGHGPVRQRDQQPDSGAAAGDGQPQQPAPDVLPATAGD